MFTTTTDQLQPAVNISQLAAWLGDLPSDDPVLNMVAIAATAQVVEFLQSELLTRTRRLVINQYPLTGTLSYPSLSRQDVDPKRVIELPYAQLLEVTEFKVYGEDTTDYEVLESKPASVYIPTVYSTESKPFLEAEYTAGYGDDISDIPEAIHMGVMMLAAFMYEHRGACDANEALMKSGAHSYLYPYRLKPVAM